MTIWLGSIIWAGRPDGIDEYGQKDFENVLTKFFPSGNSQAFAKYLFRQFDVDKSGTISFIEFVRGLTILE